MVLPPATPAASRFLSSKRQSTQQSQSHTPSQQHGGGPPRFHATPRFAASTPRPSSTQTGPHFATPALVIKSRVPRNRSTQDIIDDSSPVSPEDDLPPQQSSAWKALPEPIEFDSSLGVPQSPSPEGFTEGRSPKRRRISIASSEPGIDSAAHSQDSDEASLGSLPDAPGDHIASFHSDIEVDDDDDEEVYEEENGNEDGDPIPPLSQAISSPPPRRHPSPMIDPDPESSPSPPDTESEPDADSELDVESVPKPPLSHPLPKPFHPPRFIPASPPSRTHPSHPAALPAADIFSPRRRGTTYLPGGLAAELRDWLVEVKGGVDGEVTAGKMARSGVLGFGSGAGAGAGISGGGGVVVRVIVEGVEKGGAGMTLVEGRVVGGGREGVRVILAGEGRIEGLGGGKGMGGGNWERVVPGAVVAVALPAWDVELDGVWAVAYRWEVVEGGG